MINKYKSHIIVELELEIIVGKNVFLKPWFFRFFRAPTVFFQKTVSVYSIYTQLYKDLSQKNFITLDLIDKFTESNKPVIPYELVYLYSTFLIVRVA